MKQSQRRRLIISSNDIETLRALFTIVSNISSIPTIQTSLGESKFKLLQST